MKLCTIKRLTKRKSQLIVTEDGKQIGEPIETDCKINKSIRQAKKKIQKLHGEDLQFKRVS